MISLSFGWWRSSIREQTASNRQATSSIYAHRSLSCCSLGLARHPLDFLAIVCRNEQDTRRRSVSRKGCLFSGRRSWSCDPAITATPAGRSVSKLPTFRVGTEACRTPRGTLSSIVFSDVGDGSVLSARVTLTPTITSTLSSPAIYRTRW